MSAPTDPPQSATTVDRGTLLRLAARLQAEQRGAWLRGQRVTVEVFFARHPDLAASADAALDLIYAEYALRQELGEAPDSADYLERFPQFSAALQRQFQLDRALLSTDELESDEPETTTAATAPWAIGKYPIVTLLEQGGQATVYRALHPVLQRDVVIKLAHDPCLGLPRQRERLQREGRILARLEHPNLARVYDLDVHAGRVYLVLEYVRGQTLGTHAVRVGLGLAAAAGVVAAVAGAVALAHRHGIAHLDINPNNILVDEAGRPRLIDFGLASWCGDEAEDLSGPGRVTGTPEYMAPEQARGERHLLGPACDVFALGGVLYFLLTGRSPFTGPTRAEVLARARAGAVDFAPLAGAPAPLRRICRRALAPTPAERYRRVDDLAADLQAYARPRRRLARLAAVLAVLLLVLTAAWAVLSRPPGPTAAVPPPTPAAPVAPEHRSLSEGLAVRVWTADKSAIALRAALPLGTRSDRLQITVDAPGDLHVSLFLIPSAGPVQLLAQRSPGEPTAPLRYPADPGQGVPLTPPAGTEVLLACGRTGGPIALTDIALLWDAKSPLPPLPPMALVRLRPGGVEVERLSRPLGAPVGLPQPEATVVHRLEALREHLRGFDFVDGVALSHAD